MKKTYNAPVMEKIITSVFMLATSAQDAEGSYNSNWDGNSN